MTTTGPDAGTEPPGDRPQRVRVTAPPHRPRPGPRLDRLGDVHEQTDLGGVYLRSLLRAQLTLAGQVLGVLALGLCGLPLLFHLSPTLAEREVFGMPVAWLLLGLLAYPFMLLLGWIYVRRVDRNERAFADLVEDDR